MIEAIIAIIVGLVVLLWSADRFVDGAAASARHLGVPTLLIGMVIVGIGTSAPEMIVSAMAASDGNPSLAIGNALGSNIANTGLVLGLTALLVPLMVQSKMVNRELPILIGVCLLFGYFCYDGQLTRVEAIILLVGFFSVIGWSVYSSLKTRDEVLEKEMEEEISEHDMPLNKAILWLIIGLLILLVSSKLLVWGAVEIATIFGVSELIIGLTIVALGTSLPELAATVASARKGEHDLAIGNIVGSNMFNILAVVGIAGIIAPIDQLEPDIMNRDWPVMMLLMGALFLTAVSFRNKTGRVNRIEGGLLLAVYVIYTVLLVQAVLATR